MSGDRGNTCTLDEDPDNYTVSPLTQVERKEALLLSRDRERSEKINALMEQIADPLMDFIDQVNALDEQKNGPRAISERHILSYHLWVLTANCFFALEGFRNDEVIKKRISDKSSEQIIRQLHKIIRQGSPEYNTGPIRSMSLMDLTAETNTEYQELYRLSRFTMERMERRLKNKYIGQEQYLDDSTVLRDTVDRWILRIIHRVHYPYQELIEEIDAQRRVIFNDRD